MAINPRDLLRYIVRGGKPSWMERYWILIPVNCPPGVETFFTGMFWSGLNLEICGVDEGSA